MKHSLYYLFLGLVNAWSARVGWRTGLGCWRRGEMTGFRIRQVHAYCCALFSIYMLFMAVVCLVVGGET